MTATNPSLQYAHGWTPACGGTERPFTVRGRNLLYMWNQFTLEHAYYDIGQDLFLSDKDAFDLLNNRPATSN